MKPDGVRGLKKGPASNDCEGKRTPKSTRPTPACTFQFSWCRPLSRARTCWLVERSPLCARKTQRSLFRLRLAFSFLCRLTWRVLLYAGIGLTRVFFPISGFIPPSSRFVCVVRAYSTSGARICQPPNQYSAITRLPPTGCIQTLILELKG